jgi:hypothetical protein
LHSADVHPGRDEAAGKCVSQAVPAKICDLRIFEKRLEPTSRLYGITPGMLGGAGSRVNARGVVIDKKLFSAAARDRAPGEDAFMSPSCGSNKVHIVLTLGIFVFCGFHIYWLAGFGFFLA